MRKTILIPLLLLIIIGVVAAPPALPPPPGGSTPSDPVDAELYTLTSGTDPASPTQLQSVTFYGEYLDSDGNPITDATCTLVADGISGSQAMTYDVSHSNQYIYTYSGYFLEGTHEYNVTCGSLLATNTFTSTEVSGGYTLAAGTDPQDPFSDEGFTFWVEHELDNVPVEASCSAAFTPQSGSAFGNTTLYNSTSQRHEIFFPSSELGVDIYDYEVTCWLPPTSYPMTLTDDFTVYDRATARILSVSYSPSSPYDDDNLDFTAEFRDGYDQAIVTNCSLYFDNSFVANMTFNSSGDELYTRTISNPDSGDHLYNVTCDGVMESDTLTVAQQDDDDDDGGSSSCFTAGTLVTMADGSLKAIETINVGDLILGATGPGEVLELESPLREEYYRLELSNGVILELTNEHPVYARSSDYEGWASINPQLTMMDASMSVAPLHEMLQVRTLDGWKDISTLNVVQKEVQTYNLKRVEGNTFYAMGILVHNKGGDFFPPPPLTCTPDWSCSDWSPCVGGYHTRSCDDINECEDDSDMPVISEECVATCFDNYQNGDEEGIDCGGSCEPCETSGGEAPLVDPSQIKPQFTRQPILVNPENLPPTIEIFNDGLELYDGLTLVVGESVHSFDDSLHPGDRQEVSVDLPLNILLVQQEIQVRLMNGEVELDSGVLPIEVQWPEYGVFLDAHDDPRFYIVVDNSQGTEDRRGIEAEVKLFNGEQEIYLDLLGPYDVEANSRMVKSVLVPEHYLDQGDLELHATFYEQGEYVTETAAFFTSKLGGGFNFMPIIVILLTIVGVMILFVGMDMAYNKRGFKDEFNSFRRKP